MKQFKKIRVLTPDEVAEQEKRAESQRIADAEREERERKVKATLAKMTPDPLAPITQINQTPLAVMTDTLYHRSDDGFHWKTWKAFVLEDPAMSYKVCAQWGREGTTGQSKVIATYQHLSTATQAMEAMAKKKMFKDGYTRTKN